MKEAGLPFSTIRAEPTKIKCYVCDSVFWIEPKYREVKRREVKRGLICPYCGNALLDKLLK